MIQLNQQEKFDFEDKKLNTRLKTTNEKFEIIEETDMVVFNKDLRKLEIISLEFTDTYYNAKSLINTLKDQEYL